MKKYRGSMTIEAGAVLPLFMIGIASLISVNIMLAFQIKMQQALYNEARLLSIKCLDGHNEALSSVSEDILNDLEDMNANFSIIKDGSAGFDFERSTLANGEYIEIKVDYFLLPFGADFFGLVEIPVSQMAVIHIWNGYDRGYFADLDSEYVYVTEDSQVYHTNRECSHIKLSIKKVSGEDISSLRNEDGGKYYSCELCHSKVTDKDLYITTDGSKYHNKITCSGLKRTVRAVRLNEVSEKRPCSRCVKN